MDMTKFEGEDDPGFVAVAGELRRWSKELALLKISGNPAMQQERRERLTNFERDSMGTPGGLIQSKFENTGSVANQAGQQIVYGDFNINGSVLPRVIYSEPC